MATAWSTTTQPIAMHTGDTGPANNWVAFTPPVWARVITVQNRGGTAVRWATPGTPEAAFGAEPYVEVAPGASLTLPWTAGQANSRDAPGDVPWPVVLGSTGATIAVSLVARLSKEV